MYDFLYHDAQRIGSFLGQLDPHGHLKSLRHSAQTGVKKNTEVKVEGGASLPGLAKLGGTAESGSSNHWDQEEDRSYDPFWGNALTLLKYLEERKLLKRNMREAGVGQLVMLEGTLKILDLRILQGGWDMPTIVSKFGYGDTSNMTTKQIQDNQLALEDRVP